MWWVRCGKSGGRTVLPHTPQWAPQRAGYGKNVMTATNTGPSESSKGTVSDSPSLNDLFNA